MLFLLFSYSVVSNSLRPHEAQHARLSSTSLSPRLWKSHVHWVDDTIQPSHPVSPPSPPAFNPSQHQDLFQRVGSLLPGGQSIGASAAASVLPKTAHLISFRIDWFDLFAVQGTFKSLLQNHSPKASILWCSAFLLLQLSHLYMTTGKTTALSIWTFRGKVMSLLLKTLCRFVIAFLPRSNMIAIGPAKVLRSE